MKSINSILKYLVITGLAIVPFLPIYVANPLFFPFITGKAFAFRIIVEIIFALWLILILRERGTNTAGTDRSVVPRINKMTIFVTSFTLIVLIADIFGVNPLRSIWSNSERMEGWMTIVHLWGYFLILSSVFGSGEELKKNWQRFFNVTILAGLITAFYGLFQFFGWADIHQGSTRVDASLGNSAYMAIYMLIHAFISAYMAIINRSKKHLLWIYSIIAIFFSFIMFQTGTRGSILGWIAGIMIACFIYAVWGKKEKGQSGKSRLISAGVIVLFIVVGVSFYLNKDAKWIQSNEVLSRMASISISDTKTQARGYVWPMALEGTFSSTKTAIIGLGQENFNYLFNENYNPKMWAHEQWFDRAHNVFLDWLVATGLLGLGFYLLLYLISFIYIIKSDISIGQKSILISLIIAYSIHNIFVFDNQTSYIMFFTLLAYIHSLRPSKMCSWFKNSDQSISEDSITIRDYILVPTIVIVFGIGFYFINIRNIQANTRLIDSLRSCASASTLSIKPFESALKLNQTLVNQEIREQLVSCSINVINNNSVAPQIKEEFYILSKSEIEKQVKITPNDARMYVLAGSFFNSIGDWTTALPYIEKAKELSPGKQAIAFDLAVNYINTNKPQEAVEITKKAYESAVDYPAAQSLYVIALINNGEENKARELFPNNPELFTDRRVINVYIRNKQYDKAISIYKELLIKNPKNTEARSQLAAVYLQNKQTSLALKELETLKIDSPELKDQIDSVIKQIQSGQDPLKYN